MDCQITLKDGRKCPHKITNYDLEEEEAPPRCILHMPRADKVGRIREFQNVFDDWLKEECTDEFDFSHICFPNVDWKLPKGPIDKPVYFDNCIFYGDVDFSNRTYKEEVDFTNAEFKGKATFSTNTVFHKRVSFVGATFENDTNYDYCVFGADDGPNCMADFRLSDLNRSSFYGTRFLGGADFTNATFRGQAVFFGSEFRHHVNFSSSPEIHFGGIKQTTFLNDVIFLGLKTLLGPLRLSRVRFEGSVFFGRQQRPFSIDLTEAEFADPRRVRFTDCDLAAFLLNGCDVSHAVFYREIWPRIDGRRKILDEITMNLSGHRQHNLERELQAVAQTYRRLQANYGEAYRYPEAGDFYIGEQEMVRRLRQVRGERSLSLASNLYKWVANYGESILRPLIWLVSVLAISPIILGLIGGIGLEDGGFAVITIDSVASTCPADQTLLVGNYFSALNANVDFVFFQKSTGDKYLSWTAQKLFVKAEFVLVATFITFFLLALRRKFKRKSF